MEFFNSAIEVLQTLVVALGAGLGVWGAINLLERSAVTGAVATGVRGVECVNCFFAQHFG